MRISLAAQITIRGGVTMRQEENINIHLSFRSFDENNWQQLFDDIQLYFSEAGSFLLLQIKKERIKNNFMEM